MFASCASQDVSAQPATEASSGRIAQAAIPLAADEADHGRLIQAIGDARFVLLGESTHGTLEYYRERGRISQRLAAERGFGAVLIEADWTPAFRVNRYVRGLGSDRSAAEALGSFENFPRWMWRNEQFRDFVEALRTWNLAQPPERRVGIYGHDVYDLFNAADSVVAYLRRADPAAAARVERHYRCFAPARRDNQRYGEQSRRRPCREAAEAALAEVQRLPRPQGVEAAEEHFGIVRSAASVAAAEEYFRESYSGSNSWNARDRRMAATIEATADHVGRTRGDGPGRVVAWAHNSHIGDARATDVVRMGQINLGQVIRERHGQNAWLVGFLSYTGRVFAAPEWGEAGRVYEKRDAMRGSHSELLHQLGIPSFLLILRGDQALAEELRARRLQRMIGVVYARETERMSHYVEARLPEQFDALLFYDVTQAVTPLR
jgi:erythromycin esterase-like protein